MSRSAPFATIVGNHNKPIQAPLLTKHTQSLRVSAILQSYTVVSSDGCVLKEWNLGLPALQQLVIPVAACCVALLAAALLPAAAMAAVKKAAVVSPISEPSGVIGVAYSAFDFVMHMSHHLGEIVAKYGATTYAFLFAIVFAETGLVVTPFLPGDSLLFATGALAALGKMDVFALLGVYTVAAILGDAVNYAIGSYFGSAALKSNLIKPQHIAKTEAFYQKYGGKTVVLARFVPIVRTFAPFVAGVGSMSYAQFALYNVVGAVLWTGICVGAGYVFGNVPAVHDNFSLVVLGVVIVSLLPIAYEVWAAKREGKGEGFAVGCSGSAKKCGESMLASFH